MTPEKQKFVDDLFNTFSSNIMTGALLARLQWYLFDDEILAAVRARAISEAGYDAAQTQADLAAGMLGIAGTGHSSARAGIVKGFAQTLFSLAQSRGDPPFAPAFRDRALDAAMGRLNAMQGFQLMASAQPQLAAYINAFGGFLFSDPMVAMFIQQTVRAMGVFAMPRKQLYELYVSLSPDKAAASRVAFGLAITEMQARASGDLSGAHELATEALRLAAQTPEPEDDLQAIDHLVNKFPMGILVDRDIVECATRLAQLAGQQQIATRLTQMLGAVCMAAVMNGIEQQVLPLLADAAERVLGASPDHDTWINAAQLASRFSARVGHKAKAAEIVAQYRQRASDKERLQADILEAEVRALSGDREGACSMLERLLDQASAAERWMFAQMLVAMWPPGRPGRERFVDIFCEGVITLPSVASGAVPILLRAMSQEWGDEPVAAILERLDIGRLEATMSDAERNVFEELMKPFGPLRQRLSKALAAGKM